MDIVSTGGLLHEHFTSQFGRWSIHARENCSGNCPFHHPSNHPMREWPISIRKIGVGVWLVERMCPHLVGHPDPDSVSFLDRTLGQGTWGTHGCDLCCVKAGNEEPIMVLGPEDDVSFVLKETQIAIGGLMRCCTGSLTDFIKQNPDDLAGPGTIVYCKYEKENPTTMILGRDGVWRWNH